MKKNLTLYLLGALAGGLLTATVLLSVNVNVQHGPIAQRAITVLSQPGAAIALTACPSLWNAPESRTVAVATLFAIWFNTIVGALLLRVVVGMVSRLKKTGRQSNHELESIVA